MNAAKKLFKVTEAVLDEMDRVGKGDAYIKMASEYIEELTKTMIIMGNLLSANADHFDMFKDAMSEWILDASYTEMDPTDILH